MKRCTSFILTAAVVIAGCRVANAVGALAVGKCGAFGTSWNYPNEILAHGAALTNCPDPSCQIYATVRDSCAALAYDPNGCAWGTDIRSNKPQAEAGALATCRSYGGDSCVVATSFCDKAE
jgi:Domain of unknown function (DUF4189)